MEWQPIETAPKNGDHIVIAVFEPDEDYTDIGPIGAMVHWSWAGWFCNGLPLETGVGDGLICDRDHDAFRPTHWMPLAALP